MENGSALITGIIILIKYITLFITPNDNFIIIFIQPLGVFPFLYPIELPLI